MVLLAVMHSGCADVANDEAQGQVAGEDPAGAASTVTLVVDTHLDDGVCDADHCSLRGAMHAAMAGTAGPYRIEFEPAAFEGAGPSIRLGSALPAIVSPDGDRLTIDASGLAGRLEVNGSVAEPLDSLADSAKVDIGFDVQAHEVTLIGFDITNFDHHGVRIGETSELVILDSLVIRGNGGLGGDGGGLWLAGSGHTVRNTQFLENLADNDGDGDPSTRSGNGGNGGGAFLTGWEDNFENITVKDNAASGDGGGIFVDGRARFSIGEIAHNFAGHYGGGISIKMGSHETDFENMSIHNNTAEHLGGGAAVSGLHATFTHASIRHNAAKHGGGLYSNTPGVNHVIQTDISNNSASMQGGGVHVARGNNNFLRTEVHGNDAQGFGGGFFFYGGTNAVEGTRINDNFGGRGGGIYFHGGSQLLANVTLEANAARNPGGDGGGAYIRGGTNSISDASFLENTNSGLHVFGGENTFSRVRIENNSATFNGGGVRIQGGNNNFSHAVIRDNTAKAGAGVDILVGFDVCCANVWFENSEISNNAATGTGGTLCFSRCGGGVRHFSGNLTLLATSVHSNDAASSHDNRYGADGEPIPNLHSPTRALLRGEITAAAPGVTYRIDAYATTECASGPGDRGTQTFLSFTEVTTDAAASAVFEIPFAPPSSEAFNLLATATRVSDTDTMGNTSLPSACVLVPAARQITGGGGTPCAVDVAAAPTGAPEGAEAAYVATIARACAGTTVRVTTPDAHMPRLDIDFTQEAWGAEVDLATWAGDGSPASVAAPAISFARYAQVGFGAGVSEAVGQAELTLRLGANEVPDADKASVLVLSSPATWDAQAVASAFVDGRTALTAVGDQYETAVAIVDPAAVAIAFDVEKPTVGVVPPAGDLTGAVLLVPEVADNVMVDRVEFFLDDQRVMVDDSSPFELALDTAAYADGTYTIRVVAYDVVGNVQEWSQVRSFGNAAGAADVGPNEDEVAGGGLVGWWVGLLLLFLLAAVVVAAVVVRRRSGGGHGGGGRP